MWLVAVAAVLLIAGLLAIALAVRAILSEVGSRPQL